MKEMKAKRQNEELIKMGFRIPKVIRETLIRLAEAERRSVNDQIIFTLEAALKGRLESEK